MSRAEAVVHGHLSQPLERKFNAGCVFKRAKGVGRITHIEGLDRLLADYGEHVVVAPPDRCPRRDWRHPHQRRVDRGTGIPSCKQ